MSAVPPAAGSNGTAVLLLESGRADLFVADRRGRSLRPLAALETGDCGDGRNSDAAHALAQRLAPFLTEHRVTRVAIGLPVAWTEQLVLETPPLRGLDLLGLIQREVVRQTHLSANDLLMAYIDEGPAPKGDSRTILRLVSGVHEAAVLALVRELARHRIAVISVAAAPLVALLHAIDEFAKRSGDDAEPEVIVLARRFGFAVGVHVGRRVVQLRVLGVAVPEDPEHLATVLTEEIRRSCMFFREKTRGQDVRAVHLVGHVPSDVDGVRGSLERTLGMPVVVDACDGADRTLEAHAMLSLATRRGPTRLELLPAELGHRHAGRLRGLAAAALVLATLGVAGITAQRCGNETRHTEAEIARIAEDRFQLEDDLARHATAVAAVQQHIVRRDVVQQLVGERLDLAATLAELSAAVPDIAAITAVRSRDFQGESAVVEVHGRVAAGDFEADECVHALMAHMTQRLGARCRLIELSPLAIEHNEAFEFVFEAEWPREGEELDESP
ncbi:MAG: hypothetical protein IPH13_04070 [Planctomycetes bacterium]|nr:hypothetical protein [Planctomycetota bacterium]MCC7171771.1 hypothetical protein [Planctomycetota bacterium]